MNRSVPTPLPTSRPSSLLGSTPLFWRVFLLNAVVFASAVLTLALSPATVSTPIAPPELLVLLIGLVLLMTMNALLLRIGLAPLQRLMRIMQTVDLLRPGERLPERGTGAVGTLVRTFNAMLARLEHERATNAAHALALQEDERRRISRELHDQVGQSLTVILLELKRATGHAPEDLRADLAQVQETARASLDDVRRIARRLRPDLLEDLGLTAALSTLANEFAGATGLHVRRELATELPRLAEETQLVVYRIAQESLTNVARHAHAGTVWLSLTRTTDQLTLSVRDDGAGTQELEEGAGVRGMRERALLVAADLQVTSRPGGGTLVQLSVPLTAERMVGS